MSALGSQTAGAQRRLGECSGLLSAAWPVTGLQIDALVRQRLTRDEVAAQG
jgi:hypothetical protein